MASKQVKLSETQDEVVKLLSLPISRDYITSDDFISKVWLEARDATLAALKVKGILELQYSEWLGRLFPIGAKLTDAGRQYATERGWLAAPATDDAIAESGAPVSDDEEFKALVNRAVDELFASDDEYIRKNGYKEWETEVAGMAGNMFDDAAAANPNAANDAPVSDAVTAKLMDGRSVSNVEYQGQGWFRYSTDGGYSRAYITDFQSQGELMDAVIAGKLQAANARLVAERDAMRAALVSARTDLNKIFFELPVQAIEGQNLVRNLYKAITEAIEDKQAIDSK